ncbi:hypothetical protein DSO57_1022787 [Entomophthora muscae]|uniref:Uncharacterized protein n=1 Tax=Entomophthora muscae TaxID=34485 RepID=A0ACC2SRY0_9FUNG|nr:hypothetical protein DSO57_1022787 [Entomophthora muscae]
MGEMLEMRVNLLPWLALASAAKCSLLEKMLEDFRGTTIGGVMQPNLDSGSRLNDSPVNIRRASIADLRYYANVAGASMCSDKKLVDFSCQPYCGAVVNGTAKTPPTKGIRMVEIIRDMVTGVKGYIAVLDSRREIVVSTSGERMQSNRAALSMPALFPLDVNYSNNNNKNIRTKGVAVQALLYATANRLLEQYSATLRKLAFSGRTRGYKIVFTGHSIGAEMAAFSMIVAHHKLDIPWQRIRYIGYGMTRIGNREFVRWFNQQDLEATHVINYDEKVVYFYPIAYNYQYIGNEVFINKDGSVRICNNAYFEDPDCNLSEIDGKFREPHVQAFDTEFGMVC